jgi:hypothetical protein
MWTYESSARYWVAVASYDHVRKGVAGGFCQACHGKAAPLERMQAGDGIVYYSPRQTFAGTTPLQAFTAIGRVEEGPVYAVEMAPGFVPFRRTVRFWNARPAPIAPLLDRLGFVGDRRRWGYVFRRGHFQIPRDDFARIAAAMGPLAGGSDEPCSVAL